MSIIDRHDIIQTSIMLQDNKSTMNKIEADKKSAQDMTEQEKEKILDCLHVCERNATRQKAAISVSHQILRKYKSRDQWAGEIKNTNGGSYLKCVNRNINAIFDPAPVNPDDPQKPGVPDSITLPINPMLLSGFVSLRSKYQYFKINKINVRFVSNSANNLSPIICRYLPPSEFPETIEVDKITKFAESVGPNPGRIEITCPPFLKKDIVSGAEEGDETTNVEYNDPILYTNRCLTMYNDKKIELDYGSFIFEARNVTAAQNFIATVTYEIDFWSGVDIEAYSEEPAPQPVPDPDSSVAPNPRGNVKKEEGAKIKRQLKKF